MLSFGLGHATEATTSIPAILRSLLFFTTFDGEARAVIGARVMLKGCGVMTTILRSDEFVNHETAER